MIFIGFYFIEINMFPFNKNNNLQEQIKQLQKEIEELEAENYRLRDLLSQSGKQNGVWWINLTTKRKNRLYTAPNSD